MKEFDETRRFFDAPHTCSVDDELFTNVMYNKQYVLHPTLPGTVDTKYHLRRRPHNFKLSTKNRSITECDFITRMLFKDVHWHCAVALLFLCIYSTQPKSGTAFYEPGRGQLYTEPHVRPISCHVTSLPWQEPEEELNNLFRRSNKCIAVRKVATPLRELTCHMGSHSVTCHPTEVIFPPLPQPKLVLD